jgi:ribosomal protein L12E/L44/L45/RPP1/RPP2
MSDTVSETDVHILTLLTSTAQKKPVKDRLASIGEEVDYSGGQEDRTWVRAERGGEDEDDDEEDIEEEEEEEEDEEEDEDEDGEQGRGKDERGAGVNADAFRGGGLAAGSGSRPEQEQNRSTGHGVSNDPNSDTFPTTTGGGDNRGPSPYHSKPGKPASVNSRNSSGGSGSETDTDSNSESDSHSESNSDNASGRKGRPSHAKSGGGSPRSHAAHSIPAHVQTKRSGSKSSNSSSKSSSSNSPRHAKHKHRPDAAGTPPRNRAHGGRYGYDAAGSQHTNTAGQQQQQHQSPPHFVPGPTPAPVPVPVPVPDPEIERQAKADALYRLGRDYPRDAQIANWTMATPLVELRYEIDRRERQRAEQDQVELMSTALCLTVSAVEEGNQRLGPFLKLKGWSSSIISDRSKYERPLRAIYAMFFRRNSTNPVAELAFMLTASAFLFHVKQGTLDTGTNNNASGSNQRRNVPPPPPDVFNQAGGGSGGRPQTSGLNNIFQMFMS